MSEQDKQEAREHLGRAGRQGRHAARNVARAAHLGAEAAVDETKEVAGDVAEEVRVVAPRLSARGLAAISGDTGMGFFALAVSIYSGAIAYQRFRSAILASGRAVGR